jgi:two-component system cell cycle response regulator
MNTQDSRLKVLLIEDNPGDFRLINEMVKEVASSKFELVWADQLARGPEHIVKTRFDLILLDLGLPDSQGLETLTKVHDQASRIPIILLTGLDDEEVAIKTMKLGAQDYLIKGEVTSSLLSRAITLCDTTQTDRRGKRAVDPSTSRGPFKGQIVNRLSTHLLLL